MIPGVPETAIISNDPNVYFEIVQNEFSLNVKCVGARIGLRPNPDGSVEVICLPTVGDVFEGSALVAGLACTRLGGSPRPKETK